MARKERVVVPGLPHHVTQRGSRRQRTFLKAGDEELYLDLLSWCAAQWGVVLWAYCVMPNHVHHVAIPERLDSLALTFGVAHARYSRIINRRESWCGHLWQERFFSTPMDARHTQNACRYVLQNPVRAGLVAHPSDWPHSSVNQHLGLERPIPRLDLRALETRVEDWDAFLGTELASVEIEKVRRSTHHGWPYGSEGFVAALEKRFGKRLRPGRSGRPSKKDDGGP